MELEDLKQTWKQTEIKTNKNIEIMDLIQNKHYGPLAALKSAFLKEIIVMAIIPFILVITNLNDVNKVFTSIMFWSYVVFCIGIIVFSFYNYRLVGKMEGMDEMVSSNLLQQIHKLETRLKWNMAGVRIALLFFILLTEVVPYFQHYRILDMWHTLHPIVRFSAYAGLLILQYFVSRKMCQRKFGAHLMHLKELVKEIQN